MNIIEFKHLYVSYGDEDVLRDVNLTVAEGEHWAVLGANGSGKSTLLKLMASELHPRVAEGSRKALFGQIRYDVSELRKRMGIITGALHHAFETEAAHLNGLEVVLSGYEGSIGLFAHRPFSSAERAAALEAMAALKISGLATKRVAAMSTGELRRCIIARALIHAPEALILDEPTAGLDIEARRRFLQTLQSLASRTTIVLVTHHVEEIFPAVTHVAFVKNGTLWRSGRKEQMLNSRNLSEVFGAEVVLGRDEEHYVIRSVRSSD